MDFDLPTHFRLLRLAWLRALVCEQMSTNVFKVHSHSRPGWAYQVDVASGICGCEARGECSHLALARDRWFELEAEPLAYVEYHHQRRLDNMTLHLRSDLHASDKKYLKHCIALAEAKYAPPVVETAVTSELPF